MSTDGDDSDDRIGPALLFCPADRVDRVRKAADLADDVIIDLEDAVAPGDRPEARARLRSLQELADRSVVRISASGTEDHRLDRDAIDGTAFERVMLAKTESAEQVESLSGLSVVALIETARGVVELPQILRARNLAAVMWGSEDLIVSLGGWSSRNDAGRYRDVIAAARSAVLTTAAAFGIPAIDNVYLDLSDETGLEREAREAAESGFAAKACLHPRQVEVVRRAFRPDADRIRWAQEILAQSSTQAAKSIDGKFVDEPILQQARAVLRLRDSQRVSGARRS